MKKYLCAIILLAISTGPASSSADEVTFDRAMADVVYWLKDFRQFRNTSIQDQLNRLKTISKSSDFPKCVNENVSVSCINLVSRISLGMIEGYDQEVSYLFKDFEGFVLDAQQQQNLQRLRDASALIEGTKQVASPGIKSEEGNCSKRAIDRAYEKAIPKVQPWHKSPAFNRAVVQDLICKGQLAVNDVSKVDKVLAKNFYESALAKVKLDQRNLLTVGQLYPELKP